MQDIQVIDNAQMSLIESVDIQGIAITMQKITSMQAVVQKTLRSEHDFGVIPGTSKPTLLKPGAEKILMMFGLTSEYEFLDKVEDFTKGFFSYSVKCILTKNGNKITEGVGHCNTYEGKYRWRWVKENEVPPHVDKESLVSRTKTWGNREYSEYRIENDDPYTLANTVLKMAKKRAQVDATLTVASLSEVFTQDLEDMRGFIQQENIETMTNENAADIKLHFGKHKGKTLREVFDKDKGYINWLLNNERTDKNIKQACELIVNAIKESKESKESKGKKQKAGPADIPEESVFFNKESAIRGKPTESTNDTLEQGSFYDDIDNDIPLPWESEDANDLRK
jgi:hypothetical protein